MLFCDLVGFTGASETRDAELTRELLTSYYDLCRQRVERYGGTIEKFIGDAVMAVWGVPAAHEDDAERAVRAGLDLVAAVPQLEPGLAARAAVVSGEAAVTLGAEGQGMVAGDLVNTASRLQGLAEAGAVLVAEPTRLATERAIVFEPVGPTSLRGRAAPVDAWRAVRARPGIGGRFASEELEPPFVGRDAELRMLTELFHATAREGRLRIVSVTGQAGIGKSRLARELESYLDTIRQVVYWHRGRCPAYGEGLTYWAIGEMIRRRAGVAETDGPERTAERIEAVLDEFVHDAAERARIEPALRALVGLDTRGWSASEAGELFVAWRTLFERISEQGPVVMVFEDMQWADAGLVGFIEHVLEWSRARPILIVTLARPEFLEEHPTWGAGLRNFTSLHLEPLADEVIVEMLDGVVPGLPAGAARRLAARAEGVPLYAVETLRMLVAQGVLAREPDNGELRLVGDLSDVAVPDSLRGLVAARLDLLPAAERSLVQDAAVLGQSFTSESLAALTGLDSELLAPLLRELVRRELLRVDSDPRSPERGQYVWVQAVLREVAYATLSKRDRRTRHLAAARYFDTLGDEESAGIVADHYLEAWRSSSGPDEAGALAGQARVALRAAADRAERLRNFVQAASFAERALELDQDGRERAGQLERIGDLLARGGATRRAEARYREALAALPSDSPADDVARVSSKVGAEIVMELRIDEAVTFLEDATTRLGSTLDSPGRVSLEGQLGRAYFLAMRTEEADRVLRRTIDAAERIGPEEALIEAMISLGSSGSYGGHLSAMALLIGSAELARLAGLWRAEMRAINNLASFATDTDPAQARELTARLLEMCDRYGYEPLGFLVSNIVFTAWTEGVEAASRLAADLAGRIEPGSREEEELLADSTVLAGLRGDWERWRSLSERHRSAIERSPEMSDWRDRIAALGLLLQGHEHEAAEVVRSATGTRTERIRALVGLVRGDAAMIRTGYDPSLEPNVLAGPLVLGTRAIAAAGLRILEEGDEGAVATYLDALPLLRRSEDLEIWTLAVIALVRLAGTGRADVRSAVAELRGELERIGARGHLEALDRVLAEVDARSAGDAKGPTGQGDRPVGDQAAREAARPTPT